MTTEDAHIPVSRIIITGGFFALPFFILLERLFHGGYSAQYAAAVAIIAAAILLIFDAKGFAGWPKFKQRAIDVAMTSGRQIAMIASIILCASLVIGVLGQTGLGVKITSTILSWSSGNLWVALLLTAFACMILGMEVPTTAAYVICISVTGPALVQLGIPLLHAHLFVFWYALLSTITPPVCGTVFIAAGMVNTSWVRVAGHAMALGIGLYFIPLMLVYNRGMIGWETAPLLAAFIFVKSAAALFFMSRAIIIKAPVGWRLLQAALAVGLFLLPDF